MNNMNNRNKQRTYYSPDHQDRTRTGIYFFIICKRCGPNGNRLPGGGLPDRLWYRLAL